MNTLVKKAQLVEINGQDMTTDGRFHANLLADYLIKKHLDKQKRNKWITLREAAVAMFHSGVQINQEKIRKGLNRLATDLKSRGWCLVVEPTTKAFKLYEGNQIEKHYILNKQGYWEARAQRAEEWSEYLNASVADTSPEDQHIEAIVPLINPEQPDKEG